MTVIVREIGEVRFQEGETIRTELSYKYDRDTLAGILSDAGMRLDSWMPDDGNVFALALCSRSALAMSLDEATLVADVRSRLFAPSASALTIGAELELIPVIAATKLPHRSASDMARRVHLDRSCKRRRGGRDGFHRLRSGRGGFPTTAGFVRARWPNRDRQQPGGRLIPAPELVSSLQKTAGTISRWSAEQSGNELLAIGRGSVQRYFRRATPAGRRSLPLRMTRYLEARGEFGVRMTRQTAALQISVEHGPDPVARGCSPIRSAHTSSRSSRTPPATPDVTPGTRAIVRTSGASSYAAAPESRSAHQNRRAAMRVRVQRGRASRRRRSGRVSRIPLIARTELEARRRLAFPPLDTVSRNTTERVFRDKVGGHHPGGPTWSAPLAFVAGIVYDCAAAFSPHCAQNAPQRSQ